MLARSLAARLRGRSLMHGDVLVTGAIIMIVVMMVIPLPAGLLDLLLTFNLSLSLVVLLVTMYTLEPLEFSIFPSLLLVTTLFRLALNVSSTRLILLNGYAGKVIQQFGAFVVGGDPVVGFIVFLILVVIQYVVIVKGSERVAEVAARFTLDAMPGKQMSIDADLNSGMITDEEARRRRREIEREADFYGAMDGASKFVKGDAIAALIITAVNILGGFVVGLLNLGLSWGESLQRFTLLTVGDGLVSQIPALLISTATGIIVTRAASESNMGHDLLAQVFKQPRVLAMAAGVLVLLASVPGLPTFPFLALAVMLGSMAFAIRRSQQAAAERAVAVTPARAAVAGPEEVTGLLALDPVEIELGLGLLPLADQDQGGDLMDRVAAIRRQVALDLGIILPLVRVRDNLQLKPNSYGVKLRGAEIGSGELMLDHYLAMNPGTADGGLEGMETAEPAFGLPAVWITESQREEAELAGYTVVDARAVLATHVTELIRRHAYELLGRQEVKNLVDNVKKAAPALVEELLPKVLTLGEIQKVLQNLLREGVSIRDLTTILEALADHAPVTKDPVVLTEKVRQAMGRVLVRQLPLKDGKLRAITLDPELEQELLSSIEESHGISSFILEPGLKVNLIKALSEEVRKLLTAGTEPVVVCSPILRFFLKRMTERFLPELAFYSYNELGPGINVEAVGVVSVG